MITGVIVGDKALIARLRSVSPAIKAEVDQTVDKLGYALEAKVKIDYLSGQVLHVRTGRGRASIGRGGADTRSRFESTPDGAVAYVGTNVNYMAAWERGIAARDIVPVRAQALRFEIDGQVLFRKRVHVPAQAPRQYLEPALNDLRPTIVYELGEALKRGVAAALRP